MSTPRSSSRARSGPATRSSDGRGIELATTSAVRVLSNSDAGSTARHAVAAAVGRLAESVPTTLRWTDDEDDLVEELRGWDEAAQLVVAGGDGSIDLTLRSLDRLGLDLPVGIVPLGTGNDFARNHDIPLDPVDAAELVLSGSARGLTAIRLRAGGQDRLVANNFHVGLGETAARRAQDLKPRLGRLAYPLATAYTGLRAGPVELSVAVDGVTVAEGPLLATLVLLGPSMGGGNELVDADTDALDVVTIGAMSTLGRLRMVLRAREDLSTAEGVAQTRGRQVEIDGPATVGANVDGELLDLTTPIAAETVPDAWRVILPA